jgi:hypothetical protein
MDKPLTLFQRLTRNVRWFVEDIVTGVTGKGTLHFVYGDRAHFDGDVHSPQLRENPATSLPMLTATRDVQGNRWGTGIKD